MAQSPGIVDPETRRGLTGLQLMQGIIDGRYPAVPMHAALGFALVAVGEGTARIEGRPGPAHLNLMGGVHGGWYAAVLDTAMGSAVLSTLPEGVDFTTLEFKLNVIRALGPGEAALATGRLLHRGRRTAVVAAEMHSGDRLVATATGTCLVL